MMMMKIALGLLVVTGTYALVKNQVLDRAWEHARTGVKLTSVQRALVAARGRAILVNYIIAVLWLLWIALLCMSALKNYVIPAL